MDENRLNWLSWPLALLFELLAAAAATRVDKMLAPFKFDILANDEFKFVPLLFAELLVLLLVLPNTPLLFELNGDRADRSMAGFVVLPKSMLVTEGVVVDEDWPDVFVARNWFRL